ncbi:MAG: nucleotide exchange factor GrpE [Clostridiales bacterium]|jgi:molecular chaperone GrpE (heat shock protein)|nr:nucleotide exchange factor GrpE [Clostridiales bacterium]
MGDSENRDEAEPAKAADENAYLKDALRQLADAYNTLAEQFAKKIADNEDSKFTITDLRNRLIQHEENYHYSIIKPLIMEFIETRENLNKFSERFAVRIPYDAEAELKIILRGIDISLEKFSIFPFSGAGADFDPSTQKAVEVQLTDNKNLKDKIAKKISPGYYLQDKHKSTIIKPETVTVYGVKKHD